jgi:hypothetical protein
MRLLLKTAGVSLVVAAAVSAAGRQEARRQDGEQQTNEAPQPKNPIRTHVNEVILPVTVVDRKGEFVLDLTQADFQIFDKGVEQKINQFDIDADPLAVVLLVEANLRLQAMAPVIQGMGTIFTETVMAQSGKAAVITYGERPPPQLKLPKIPPIVGATPYTAIAIWLLKRGTDEISNHQLEIAAASTGGIHYRTFHEETIRKALDRIGGELHVQYVLGYAPSADPDPGFNEIKVVVARQNVTLRVRPGYFGQPQDH